MGQTHASEFVKLTEHLRIALHYFNGMPVKATDGDVLARVLDAHGRETDRAALVHKAHGAGARC